MSKICDHKSVGMLVWQNKLHRYAKIEGYYCITFRNFLLKFNFLKFLNDKKLLLIERKKPPFGFTPPAGHVDQDISYETAAKRELKEEAGLETKNIKLLIDGYKNNPCRRVNGTWHY